MLEVCGIKVAEFTEKGRMNADTTTPTATLHRQKTLVLFIVKTANKYSPY
jgi:hypothetical protein